ncbi:DUF6343 family protein [Streptomyces sp. MS06]|uniref:DUF6343 family protein n=1 Tax=Streptomyces sp. MS06 TaxID=3385974 RepID=UPI0039A25015
MRTGSEPTTARSALRMRFWLSVWGLAWTAFGTVVFALVGRAGWAAVCGVLCLVAAVDLVVIRWRIRQGAHFQPGRAIPPYRLPEQPAPPRRRPYPPPRGRRTPPGPRAP